MADLSIQEMKEKAEALRRKAALKAIVDLIMVNGLTVQEVSEYLKDLGTTITDQQRLVDHRRKTSNSNKQLENLAKAREVKAAKAAAPVAEPPAAKEEPSTFIKL